ncbi:MAG: ABC transporter substrate-binding protein [Rhizobiales bacterium]|nr:ABC transporter substrate-binding protein [Hyphomicrobiales bacterium]
MVSAAPRPGRDRALTTRRRFAALALGLGAALSRPARAAAPERVVAIDWGLAATLLSLGVTPLGIAETRLYRTWVAEPALPPAVRDIGLRTAPNLELLATLKPDLIVMTRQSENARALLRRIAPILTIDLYADDRRPLDRALAAVRELGTAFDRQDAAIALLGRFEATLADARRRIGSFGRPVLAIGFMDARHVRVYGQGSLFADVLDRIGLVNAWRGPTNAWGFSLADIAELAAYADSRILVIEPTPPEAAASLTRAGLWRALPFVRDGRVTPIDPVWAFGDITAAGRFAGLVAQALAAPAVGHAG